MILDSAGTLSAFVLDLYRACRETSIDAYQRWALERIKTQVPFDAALWASGVFGDDGNPIIHNIILVNRPLELMADYEQVKPGDHLAHRNAQNPGVACVANSVGEHPESSPELVAYLEKWRIVHALACHTIDPLTRLATAIALWREDRAAPFDEDERLFFEHAMPHLIESYGMNRIVQLERAALSGSAGTYASATVDPLGELQIAPPEFQRLLLAEWADWRGHRLPEPIRHLVDGHDAARFVGARIAVRATRMNDVFLLQARKKEAVDALSERELGIARLCAKGMTYKEIARRLGISPGTVRSHINSIFDKLHLHKQSELAAALRDLD